MRYTWLLFRIIGLFMYGKAAGLDICFFTSDGLAWSTTCGSVKMLQVGGQSTSVRLHITRRNSATLLEKGEVDLNNRVEWFWLELSSHYFYRFVPKSYTLGGWLLNMPYNVLRSSRGLMVWMRHSCAASVGFGSHTSRWWWQGRAPDLNSFLSSSLLIRGKLHMQPRTGDGDLAHERMTTITRALGSHDQKKSSALQSYAKGRFLVGCYCFCCIFSLFQWITWDV